MTFNEGIRTDPNRIKTPGRNRCGGRWHRGPDRDAHLHVHRVDLSGVLGGASTGTDTAGADLSHCVSAEAANQYVECRMVATAESLDVLWEEALPAQAGSST
jgi:hypothetical protein